MQTTPTLVLHIGAGKTGSTSIQFTLRQAAEKLAKQHTFYAGLMLEKLPVATQYSWCVEGAPHRYFQESDLKGSNEEVYQTIYDELLRLGREGVRQVIWSNEAFLTRHDRILPVIEQLVAAGVPVRIIAYVRRHDKWARSAYIQFGLKFKSYKGPLRNFSEWAANQNMAFASDLEIWRNAFPEKLELFNFDAIGDVACHFLELCKLEGVDLVRANDSPSNALLAAWSVFNGRQDGVTRPDAFRRLARPLKVLQNKGEPVPPLNEMLPDTADLMFIQDAYREDYDEVNALLKESGQPPMEFGPLDEKSRDVSSWELDRMLFQMVFSLQRQVLELQVKLEEQTKDSDVSS